MNTTNTTDIFKQKALGGYLMCFMNHCPLREQCLHWQVGQHMPQNPPTCICVNPHGEQVATENCKLFRTTQKQRMAKGMEGIFNDDMPKRLEPAIRNELIMRYNRTYFFEYRNGAGNPRPLPPARLDPGSPLRRLRRRLRMVRLGKHKKRTRCLFVSASG